MTIVWSTPAGVPATTNYDMPLGQQKLPQVSLPEEERNVRAFFPKQKAMNPIQQLPDSCYELTKDEARKEVAPRGEALLVTKTYKEEQRIQRNAKHSFVTIKIRFPDNSEVLRNYHPLETMTDVYTYTEHILCNKWGFVLRLCAGKRKIIPKDNTTLAKLNFVPGAILLLEFTEKEVTKPYFTEEILSIFKEKE